MAQSLWHIAARYSYDDFKAECEEQLAAGEKIPEDVLPSAAQNPESDDRVKILNYLLDQGLDPSVAYPTNDNTNVLHALFSHRPWQLDFDLEAPVLKRLLEGGCGYKPAFAAIWHAHPNGFTDWRARGRALSIL